MSTYLKKYYTDTHDVDEDRMTITDQGGQWNTWSMSGAAGIMCRDLFSSLDFTLDHVA